MKPFAYSNVALFAIGPAVVGVLGLITVPLFTWVFPAPVLGQYAIMVVALGMLGGLVTLGLDQSFAREFNEVPDVGALLRASLVPGLLLTFFVGLALLLLDGEFQRLMWGSEYKTAGYAFVLTIVANFVGRFAGLSLRMRGRAAAYSAGMVIPRVGILVGVAACYLFLRREHDIEVLVWVYAISSVITSSYLCIATRADWTRCLEAKRGFPQTKSLLRYGFPLMVSASLFTVVGGLDRISLRVLSDLAHLGTYAVAISVAAAMVVLQQAFNVIWTPYVFSIAKTDEERTLAVINRMSRVAVVLLGTIYFAISLMRDLLQPLIQHSYHDAIDLIPICLLFPLFYTLSEITVAGSNIARRTGNSIISILAALLIGVVAALTFVPGLAGFGAGIASALAGLTYLVSRTEISCMAWKVIERRPIYLSAILLLISAILCGRGEVALYATILPLVLHVALLWKCYVEATELAMNAINPRRMR